MKIKLYLRNKISEFLLPPQISGSYGFDDNQEEEKKLINIEGMSQKWILYSTEYVSVIEGGKEVESVELIPNHFYYLKRDDITYLIYATLLYDSSIKAYAYSNIFNLNINPQGTLRYNIPIVNKLNASIAIINNKIILNYDCSIIIYLNNKAVLNKETEIKIGDTLEIYGMTMHFINNMIFINNPNELVVIDLNNTGLAKTTFPGDTEEIKTDEVIDKDMYMKEDYYYKSPRIRRQIETKDITITPPPVSPAEEKTMPPLLVLGPMMTMSMISMMTLLRTINNIVSGSTTIAKSWPQLLTGIAMLISTLIWPRLTKAYIKHVQKIETREIVRKYDEYLKEKARELSLEMQNQKEILEENLLTEYDCLNIMNRKGLNFWDKRIDQNDLLVARVGVGDELLDINLNFSKDDFKIEENALKEKAEAIIEQYKYIKSVPIGYSFYKNKTTAIMGNEEKTKFFINNIILQFITFYSYDDLKIVLFTNNQNKHNFDYMRYLNHCFSNDKSFRFISTDQDSAKRLAEYLTLELNNRIKILSENPTILRPYFLVIVDDYDMVRRLDLINLLTEVDQNLGFSLVILESHLNKLPSKCNNFILIGEKSSGIMTNSYDMQTTKTFYDEIKPDINMDEVTRTLSNIPVEISEGASQLQTSCTFLEMEKIGKVEQLNILNRWTNNDSTTSLKAEIGIDQEKELIYLDLHEKAHGPHGLIAGMTGSGKSEFIITYILSMAINYSPDDVAFILIDYKGGGLAYAFENKTTGMTLPHLAGTITNLDKSEMSRTLVSIDSEVKRRQKLFNQARDQLRESTIDIYKYQKNYHEGKLFEPCPHLFIICDEFAELKSQQPEFMNNLISIARIGRSLGVHLILATQKPSGVVNEQIWSNTKFRVCLKVQDAGDSKEMLKRPEAASIKEAGRFYLQVGYDELFILGQSGWCGAKYFPSNTIVKEEDKSINFINDTGIFIKSIKAESNKKIEMQGEQLAAILKSVIETAESIGKKTKRLWLDNVPAKIYIEDLINKYKVIPIKYQVKGIIGEYDAPENQEQGLLEMDYLEAQNTFIYGTEEAEKEELIKSLIFSTCLSHDADEVNFYVIDYGSESMGILDELPQVGDVCFQSEDEKFRNTLKLIKESLKKRKKEYLQYGGDYVNYLQNSPNKEPLIILAINNLDALVETRKGIIEQLIPIARECARYGIYFWISLSGINVAGRRLAQSFSTIYCLHLKDPVLYRSVVPGKSKLVPNDYFARGITNNNGVHEFQTASITENSSELNSYIKEKVNVIKSRSSLVAPPVPKLPTKVTYDLIVDSITDLKAVPIGVERETLDIMKYDFTAYDSTVVSAFKIQNVNNFILSLLEIIKNIPNLATIIIDIKKILPEMKKYTTNYYSNDAEKTVEILLDFMKKRNEEKNYNGNILFIFYGIEALKLKLPKTDKLGQLIKEIKNDETSKMIVCDGTKGIKAIDMELWYTPVRNNSDGIWIGRGFTDQQFLKVSNLRDVTSELKSNYGYCVIDQFANYIKLIDFTNDTLEDDDNEE